MSSIQEDLQRIRRALGEAARIMAGFTAGAEAADRKAGGDPVTRADRAVDEALRALLPRGDEGWLSEETRDDPGRLERSRVWVVDPLDGTREFLLGIPEFSVSVALVEEGEPVAGGILNPATGELILGGRGAGVLLDDRPAGPTGRDQLEGALVLASRSEVARGEWERFRGAPFTVREMGSVAWKLALVAAGRADATWTLVPKHEWDVAAGVALVRAAGGVVSLPDGATPAFNRPAPLLPGLLASAPGLAGPVRRFLAGR